MTSLYFALTPLPLLWVLAWRHNTRRALHYHIPQLSILDLLCEPSPQAKTVGTIAALYVDATKLHPLELDAILAQLTRLAKRSRTKELLCRAYAIRILWFAHIKVALMLLYGFTIIYCGRISENKSCALAKPKKTLWCRPILVQGPCESRPSAMDKQGHGELQSALGRRCVIYREQEVRQAPSHRSCS